MSAIELFSEIKNNNLNNVKEILQLKPNLINFYLYGVTPLLYAVECGHENLAIELCKLTKVNLSLTDNEDCTCLEKATEKNFLALVEFICKNNKEPNLNEILSNDETYLTYSIKLGNYDVTNSLLKAGCDPNNPNKLGEYPLQLLIKHNKKDVLKDILTVNNLKINRLPNGFCPLLEACEMDLTEICILLIDSGLDLNIRDKNNYYTPLMHAVSNRNETVVAKLLEKNCDVNLVDLEGNSALHLAAFEENEFIIKRLLKSNSNKFLKNNQGLIPLAIAKEQDADDIIEILS